MTEQAAPSPGFFKRNWKWLVPVGCLTPLLCCGGGAVAIVVGVFGVIKSSPVYVEALAKASNDPEVVEALGAPITPSWVVSGNISDSGGTGTANFTVPLNGSKQAGVLFVEADKSAGMWRYEVLQVAVGGGQRIDLNRDADDPPEVDEVDEAFPNDEEPPDEGGE